MKVFISQPMKELSDGQILEERHHALDFLKTIFHDREIEVLDSFYLGAPAEIKPLWFLGRSIQVLSMADLAFFCKGWEKARGCRIEHECAEKYGIKIVEEA